MEMTRPLNYEFDRKKTENQIGNRSRSKSIKIIKRIRVKKEQQLQNVLFKKQKSFDDLN